MLLDTSFSGLIIIFGAILLSMAFHEATHAFVGHWLGDTTAKDMGRLSLNPLKHIDILTTVLLPLGLILLGLPPFFAAKPVPFNPDRVKYDEFGAALIGVSGPLSNLLLALVGTSIVRLAGMAVGTNVYMLFSTFIAVNIGLFIFNMIPFPPLDGSRLLYAVAPEPLQRIMYQIETMGFTAILVFMFLLFPVVSPVVHRLSEGLYTFLLS
jgi:Zn-dependent protease